MFRLENMFILKSVQILKNVQSSIFSDFEKQMFRVLNCSDFDKMFILLKKGKEIAKRNEKET
jgi:hypothetical protein